MTALAAAGSTLGAPPAHAAGDTPAPVRRIHPDGGPARAAIVPRSAGSPGAASPGVSGT